MHRSTLLFFLLTLLATTLTAHADITCEGRYGWHLQGIASDEEGNLYWSFTVDLVKTDADGKVLAHVEVPSHHGDSTYADGMVYVATRLAKIDKEAGEGRSWVYAYKADDLSFAWRKPVRGVGGIGVRDGHFFIADGQSPERDAYYICEYDEDMKFVKQHAIACGQAGLGIQTACYAQGAWWFGYYGKPAGLLKTDENFTLIQRSEADVSLGITAGPDDTLLVGRSLPVEEKRHGGKAMVARPTEDGGLTMDLPE